MSTARGRIQGFSFPAENKDNSLDNFTPHTSDQAALLKVAQETKADSAKVVFVSGPAGCGKTHLLRGLARSFVAQEKHVYYLKQGESSYPGCVENGPANAILMDDLLLPPAAQYYTIEKPTHGKGQRYTKLHCNITFFMAWLEYATENNALLWVTTNRLDVEQIFNPEKIQKDLDTLKSQPESDRIDTENLEKLLEFATQYKEIFSYHRLEQPEVKHRKALADTITPGTRGAALDSLKSNPGSPPGIIMMTAQEYQSHQLPMATWKSENKVMPVLHGDLSLSPEEDQAPKVFIIDMTAPNPPGPHELFYFSRAAFDNNLLLLVITEKDKKTFIQEILAHENTHEMHSGSSVGNRSRLESMVVSYGDLYENSNVPPAARTFSDPTTSAPSIVPQSSGLSCTFADPCASACSVESYGSANFATSIEKSSGTPPVTPTVESTTNPALAVSIASAPVAPAPVAPVVMLSSQTSNSFVNFAASPLRNSSVPVSVPPPTVPPESKKTSVHTTTIDQFNQNEFIAQLREYVNKPSITADNILEIFDYVKDKNNLQHLHTFKMNKWNKFRLFFKKSANDESNFWHTETYQQTVKILKDAFLNKTADKKIEPPDGSRLIDYIRGNSICHCLGTSTARKYKKSRSG